MALKAGYVQTEVGAVPKDWKVSELRDVCRETITYGIVQCGPHVENGVPYIRVTDMDKRELDVTGMLRTSPSIAAKFSRSTMQDGDIVYALRGILGEVRQVGRELVGANLTQGTARLSPSANLVNGYLLWALRNPQSLKQAELEAKGSTFREISLADLRRVKVLVPTKVEQELIAEALSDADALIESLEQLLLKKRQIKQGTMQELLTGKRRLPGFDGEWKTKTLGSVVEIVKGQLITEKRAISGQIPVIAGGKQPAYFHNQSNRVGKTITISGSGASAGFVAFHDYPIFASDCSTIGESVGYSVEYIFFNLQLNQDQIYKSQTGGAQPHIHPRDLQPLTIRVPPTTSEQTAIATILSDMDADIAALESRLAKARHIKQGMMQQLLTGKIRLI